MTRRYHLALNVRGFILNTKYPRGYEGMFLNDDNSEMSAKDAQDFLFGEIEKGRKVIPCSSECGNPCMQKGCAGFDYAGGGCPGYEIEETPE